VFDPVLIPVNESPGALLNWRHKEVAGTPDELEKKPTRPGIRAMKKVPLNQSA